MERVRRAFGIIVSVAESCSGGCIPEREWFVSPHRRAAGLSGAEAFPRLWQLQGLVWCLSPQTQHFWDGIVSGDG